MTATTAALALVALLAGCRENFDTSEPAVVVAGVTALSASDTTLTEFGDTALAIGAAFRDQRGAHVLLPNQGLTWTRTGPGAVTLLDATGDAVRVVAAWRGTDTLIVTYSQCQGGAPCADTVLVTVNDPMIPGGDLVVLADANMFGRHGDNGDPDNHQLYLNLASFTNTRLRAAGTTVMSYTGASSLCATYCDPAPPTGGAWFDGLFVDSLHAVLTRAGYTFTPTASLPTTIPADVKVIVVWLPNLGLSTAQVNLLKQFASEGGRVVVISENDEYFAGGHATVTQLLGDLGTSLTNTPARGQDAQSAVGPHQVVNGVGGITVYWPSSVTVGANATVLFRDSDGVAFGAVAPINTTRLP